MLDLAEPLVFDPAQVERDDRSLWRYRHTFPLPPDSAPVMLGEGGTPLLAAEIEAETGDKHAVHFKLEYLNPTGSFKDRGTTVLLTHLVRQGVVAAVEDSSGNAGASFAAYCARAGIAARIFVPAYAAGGKLAQIRAFGAELVPVPGPRSRAAEAVQSAAAEGAYYASHNYDPVGLAGLATVAYELVEQLGCAPGTVVLPTGHGTLLLGVYRGFRALQTAGVIAQLPHLVGVQAEACAPLWAFSTFGPDGLGFVTEGDTLAEGIRILNPVRGDAVLAAVRESGGEFMPVKEVQIEAGRSVLARCGFYVEPTSAVVWAALRTLLANAHTAPVVAILTGSGYKYQPY
ncbi:MAG: threonine synthase [Anaerolineales bacterium]